MYKCRNFKIYELVPPNIYKKSGEKAWLLFDDRILWTIDAIHDELSRTNKRKIKMYVNNWKWGGLLKGRGYRQRPMWKWWGMSQHYSGRAIDFHIDGISSGLIRKWIINNRNKLDCLKYIRGVEDFDGMSWVHVDVRNHDFIKFGKG